MRSHLFTSAKPEFESEPVPYRYHPRTLQLLGIHSTKKAEFLSIMLAISWSTSFEESLPRKATEHERYLPAG